MVANDFQVKGGYEREARMNLMRGGRALCAVDGQAVSPEDIALWTRVIENWPSYLKAAGLDVSTVALAWYLYDQRKKDGATGDTFYNTYIEQAAEPDPATESAQ